MAARPKTLILDVYGRYAPQVRGWVAVSDLVLLMGLLGVDAAAVRSAVSRMTRRGLLRPEIRDGARGYATTDAADELFAEADRRIYAALAPARLEDGWVLVSFSVPEHERDKRHLLRSRLMWLGLGNLSSALWIGPQRLLADVRAAVAALGLTAYVDVFSAGYEGFADAAALAQRAWDLPELARLYESFLARHRPARDVLRRVRHPVAPQRAFVVYTLALHDWRKLPYLDPGLPSDVLPARWPGGRARDLFDEMRSMLELPAFEYVAAVVGRR